VKENAMSRRPLLTLVSAALLGFLAAAGAQQAQDAPKKFTFIDLQPKANHKLADSQGSGREGNDLKEVPTGERTFGGVRFKIGEGYIQLHSKLLQEQKPEAVNDIAVGQKFAKLHILQATAYGNGQVVGQKGEEGDPLYVADGTKIAEYRIRYADGKTETVPVVYGEDVRDWWYSGTPEKVKRGRIAWKGDNPLANELKSRLRLYLVTWENPRPDVRVTSIDYVKVGDNPAAPFCVALTMERK
jgi:hypothetical protein